MARVRSRFVCQQCGAVSVKWQGRCADCGEWNTMVEEAEPPAARRGSLSPTALTGASPVALADVVLAAENRFKTGVGEFDRVAGGGVVPGSLIVVGGPPGIGKSTLLLQVAEGVGRGGGSVLYVTGEESLQQVRMRADRIGVRTGQLRLLSETELDAVVARTREASPRLLIVDSVQTLYNPEVTSAPGSVSQVRECTAALMRMAKATGVSVVLVGHVTKDGTLAGPRVMEHLVDTVLYFEGDGLQSYRVLKSVKNRFGPTHEVGLFEMRGQGLCDVPNASEFFLSQRVGGAPGSCVVPILEGTRSMLVEVQALCNQTHENNPNPARRSTGIDGNRVVMLLAVLSKREKLGVGRCDVFVNIAGGIEVDEPGADLGLVVAIASSLKNVAVPEGMAFIGEVGLGGEVRGVAQLEQRIAECARMGMTRVVVPAVSLRGFPPVKGVEVIGVGNVSDALQRGLRGSGNKVGAEAVQERGVPKWA